MLPSVLTSVRGFAHALRALRWDSALHVHVTVQVESNDSLLHVGDVADCSALVLATLNQHPETVSFLHGRGAAMDRPCRSGMTALMFAAKMGSLELVKVRLYIHLVYSTCIET